MQYGSGDVFSGSSNLAHGCQWLEHPILCFMRFLSLDFVFSCSLLAVQYGSGDVFSMVVVMCSVW